MNRQVLNRLVASSFALIMATVGIGVESASAAKANDQQSNGAYLLQEQPDDAADVLTVRKDAKDQQAVVVVGRIGGRKNPWIKGAAAFSIVDRSLKPCSEIEGDTCRTPWDYCCEANLPKATVLVMVVDDEGKLVKQDARELLGVKELDTLFITGKAKRDKAGNVTILASKVFLPTEKKETTR
jgi:hypothetical protein